VDGTGLGPHPVADFDISEVTKLRSAILLVTWKTVKTYINITYS